MSLAELLDRYEKSVSADTQERLGELVVAVAREVLAQRTLLSAVGDLGEAVDDLCAAVDDHREQIAALTRDPHGAVVATAQAVQAPPTHADLNQLASSVSALAQHERWRVALLRVRRGDLVRCARCEGLGCVDGERCPDCTDDAGSPLHGVAGLVPPHAKGGAS